MNEANLTPDEKKLLLEIAADPDQSYVTGLFVIPTLEAKGMIVGTTAWMGGPRNDGKRSSGRKFKITERGLKAAREIMARAKMEMER